MLFLIQDLRIVLIRPRNPLNIAAAARAMMNFGFQDLVVVAPYEPVWQESRAAPGAEVLLQKALIVPDLLSAIEDRTLVLGASSLSRRTPSQTVLLLDQLANSWKQKEEIDRVAILFGSEKNGLSNEDLGFCHAILQIPTAPQCPSMNLGQAVAICCYEFWHLAGSRRPSRQELPVRASVGEITRLADAIEKLLSSAEKPQTGRDKTRKVHLRQILLRWPLTSQDVTLALGLLRDLAWQLHDHAPRRSPSGGDPS